MNSNVDCWGWRLVFLAGILPACAGSIGFMLALVSMTVRHDQPWWSLMGAHSFSADDMARWNPGFLPLWNLVNSVGGAALSGVGVAISWLSWAGLRKGHTWVRSIILFLLIWVGVNDTIALLRFRAATGQGVPFGALPVALGTTGLWISRERVSRK